MAYRAKGCEFNSCQEWGDKTGILPGQEEAVRESYRSYGDEEGICLS